MTHYFRLYFSIEPVVRARRLAAENEIEMCDDREDCCSGKAYSKNEDLVYDLFNDQDRKSRFVIIVSRSSFAKYPNRRYTLLENIRSFF